MGAIHLGEHQRFLRKRNWTQEGISWKNIGIPYQSELYKNP